MLATWIAEFVAAVTAILQNALMQLGIEWAGFMLKLGF
jgi:hypothetical protein